MIGFFIKGDEAKITRTGNTSVSLEMYDGRKFENLEPLQIGRGTRLNSSHIEESRMPSSA